MTRREALAALAEVWASVLGVEPVPVVPVPVVPPGDPVVGPPFCAGRIMAVSATLAKIAEIRMI